MIDYLPFIIFLMVLAVFLRAESALTILYMVVGTFILGLWWNRRALRYIEVRRVFENHAFLSEQIPIKLIIKNRSILPILWIEIHESLPTNLRAGISVKQVFSLGSKGEKEIHYNLQAFKRGYYSVGPLMLITGDPLGLVEPSQIEVDADPLTIYPEIVPLESVGLPSRSPFGILKHHNPVFEDPSRIIGKRDFKIGDSIRRIDWKSSAATGKLQVKLYEASIALDVALLLDLQQESYHMGDFYDATELAITATASLAAWGKRNKQSIGLFTNGIDPFNHNISPKPMLPRKGAGHFVNILEVLARIQPGTNITVTELIQSARAELPWGTTLVLISGQIDPERIYQLYQMRKAGLNVVVLLCGHTTDFSKEKQLAYHYNITLQSIAYRYDLEMIGETLNVQ